MFFALEGRVQLNNTSVTTICCLPSGGSIYSGAMGNNRLPYAFPYFLHDRFLEKVEDALPLTYRINCCPGKMRLNMTEVHKFSLKTHVPIHPRFENFLSRKMGFKMTELQRISFECSVSIHPRF